MRTLLALLLLVHVHLLTATSAVAAGWDEVLARARGQTVHLNAWGGKEEINAFLAWAGAEAERRHGVAVVHVKLASTAEAVTRILAEKTAGRTAGGSVDLLWVNGENFASMAAHGLLAPAWTHRLPAMAFVQADNPALGSDFGTPVLGREAPWGLYRLHLAYDPARLPDPPRTASGLLAWATSVPGRFTYPSPENFIGHSFLKQLLLELAPDPAVLGRPVAEIDLAAATAPLWAYLDALHPLLWRRGRVFPENESAQRQLLADGEIDVSIAFGTGETSAAIAQGLLPERIRTFAMAKGTLANASFLAIPFNATAPEGAMVLTDLLLSPEAQARMQDPRVWGVDTVLDLARLPPAERARFAALPRGVATLTPAELGPVLPEPHFSWTEALRAAWRARYQR